MALIDDILAELNKKPEEKKEQTEDKKEHTGTFDGAYSGQFMDYAKKPGVTR